METDKVSLGESQIPSSIYDFRDYLRHELIERCRKNPRYSMRAFARTLGVESSFLSKILLGRRSVTTALIERLSQPLRIDNATKENFQKAAVQTREESRAQLRARNRADFVKLSVDTFEVIAAWQHYAIMELTLLAQFKSSTAWIARTLGIDEDTAQDAVDRLLRVGLLIRDEKGELKCNENCSTTSNKFTHLAFQKLQTDLLNKAAWAMEKVPMEMRDQSSITMAIDSRRLPQAKEKIKTFRRQLMRYCQKPQKKDSIYQLMISFYPTSSALVPVKQEQGGTA